MQSIIYIYQLKNNEETKSLHDKGLDELHAFGRDAVYENYDLVWEKTADPEDEDQISEGAVNNVLEYYYSLLNEEQLPEGYGGGAISIGDVIAICHDGRLDASYIDVQGFKLLNNFFPQEVAEEICTKAQYSDEFSDLPGFQQPQQGQQSPEPYHERHFYTSLYIDMASGLSEEEADEMMRSCLEEIKSSYPEFAYTIHDAETNDYYD